MPFERAKVRFFAKIRANFSKQLLFGVSPLATRGLQELVKMRVIAEYGKGAGAGYILGGIQPEEDEEDRDEDELAHDP